jgi:hypothetical protein
MGFSRWGSLKLCQGWLQITILLDLWDYRHEPPMPGFFLLVRVIEPRESHHLNALPLELQPPPPLGDYILFLSLCPGWHQTQDSPASLLSCWELIPGTTIPDFNQSTLYRNYFPRQ